MSRGALVLKGRGGGSVGRPRICNLQGRRACYGHLCTAHPRGPVRSPGLLPRPGGRTTDRPAALGRDLRRGVAAVAGGVAGGGGGQGGRARAGRVTADGGS